MSIFISLGKFIASIIQLLLNTFDGLITLIVNIPQYISFLTDSLNVLPTVLIPFITICIFVYAIRFVIGREN